MRFVSVIECQIHKCLFGLEAPKDADEKMRHEYSWCECPICARIERQQLREKLAHVTSQNIALIAAIEIKQEHLQKVKE